MNSKHSDGAGQLQLLVSPHPLRNASPTSFAPTGKLSAKCCSFAGELPGRWPPFRQPPHFAALHSSATGTVAFPP
ncbi:hypothetical protein [Pontibacter diazotrophicus]|uniref:hypothetical protein n=1 Tax=Pontibacter diazotrophicus TaxID=1400979 RepID=UPI0011C05C0F|nr:hypothetical protein [Pontibacter diazotrophicus]